MSDNNIFRHASDSAKYVKVDLTNTVFTGNNDLQSVLEKINPSALLPLPVIPPSNETTWGLIKVSTDVEVQGQTDNQSVLTPQKLDNFKTYTSPPTETQYGFPEIATQAETNNLTLDTKVITPYKLEQYISTVGIATESSRGSYSIATEEDAIVATNDSVAMTPKKTYLCIVNNATRRVSATETAQGVVRIATELEASRSSTRYPVVTPNKLNYTLATNTHRGLYRVPEGHTGSNEDVITPASIPLLKGTSTYHGFFNLIDNLNSTSDNDSLTASMGVLLNTELIGKETGGEIEGDLKVPNIKTDLNLYRKEETSGGNFVYIDTKLEVDAVGTDGLVGSFAGSQGRPVGSIFMTMSDNDPSLIFGGRWERIQARVLIGVGSSTDSRGETQSFTSSQRGGEYTHNLKVTELPKHQHAGWGEARQNYWPWGNNICTKYGTFKFLGSAADDYDNYLLNSEPVGGSQPHNNMQPYICPNIWRRIK